MSRELSGDRYRKVFERCEENVYGNEICMYLYEDTRARRYRYVVYFIDETFGERIFVRKSVTERELDYIRDMTSRMRVSEIFKRLFT